VSWTGATTGLSVCCKTMFWVFQRFRRNVASVSRGCCKSRSRCCNVVKLDLDVADVIYNVADVVFECCGILLHVARSMS
jgi:uncharacterized membrane protein